VLYPSFQSDGMQSAIYHLPSCATRECWVAEWVIFLLGI
jgi:hypothetical protein